MWTDLEDWGRPLAGYVVKFTRDRYHGPTDDGLEPLFAPENYHLETRYIYIRGEIVADTTDIEDAAKFDHPHEAAKAIQLHRAECGDVGRLYEITPLF